MTKREEKTQKTQKKLLSVADQLISKMGYEQVLVEDITKASGVAKGTFYNYFNKKEDLIVALEREHFSGLKQNALKIEDNEPVLSSITNYLLSFMKIIADSGPARVRNWVRFSVTTTEPETKWNYDLNELTEFLKKLIDNNKLKSNMPVDKVATLLNTQMYGIIFSWSINESIDPIKATRSFCEKLLEPLFQPYVL